MREHSGNELDRLIASRVGAAPRLEPPAHLRERVLRAMAEAAVSATPPGGSALRPFSMAAGVAAVTVLAGLLAVGSYQVGQDAPGAETPFADSGGPPVVTSPGGTEGTEPADVFRTLEFASDSDPATLMAVSGDLERTLARLPASRRLMGADTASTIAALETQIALIDERLMLGSAAGLAPEVRQALWWDRVNALNALVQVRYAQSEVFVF